jgi:hypothetical protein
MIRGFCGNGLFRNEIFKARIFGGSTILDHALQAVRRGGLVNSDSSWGVSSLFLCVRRFA